RFNVTAPEGFGLRCLHAWRSEKVSDKHCSDDRVRECGGAGRLRICVRDGCLVMTCEAPTTKTRRR
ncbi:hypothetical protein, partial [Tahibacter aquaticus]|uniref:hypothetical protein n=1 Tax=Tahibacter aquaticus TaxID=520092 RepID=UPI001AACF0CC